MTAQTFTTLYNFSRPPSGTGTNSDGTGPLTGLALSGNTLYGTANVGGEYRFGSVYKISTDGTGFTNLHSFTGPIYIYNPSHTNGDGANPYCDLVLSGDTLYGTANGGGSLGYGTVFKINTDGTGFTNLHSFTPVRGTYYYQTNSDGARPIAGVILFGNTLYGTASSGGVSGNGTVFALTTNGTGFEVLHTFAENDKGFPTAPLIFADNTLYGTSLHGGIEGSGAVFKLNIDGTGFTNLHSFAALANNSSATNADGGLPYAGLTLVGDTLCGTASGGGIAGGGTVFALNTDGTGFTVLHTFSTRPRIANSDGSHPLGRLLLTGHTLYGTAEFGGAWNNGTVFAINTDGTGFTNLYSILGNPEAGVILSGNTLYGTTYWGGSNGLGSVFSLSLPPPQLKIIPSGGDIILTWPTNANGFTLQSTTNLVSPLIWNTAFPNPTVVNGENVVTNSGSGTQNFYRLSQ